MRKLILVLIVLWLSASIESTAEIIHVPGDYPTIQGGIDACNPGDTVIVADGIYMENVVIDLAVSLFGENRDGVIIDGAGAGDVLFIESASVSVGNLTLRNSGWEPSDCGIELSFADSCMIEYCRFGNNYSGIYLYGSSKNTVSRCLFTSNINGIQFHQSYSEPTPDNRENNILNNIIEDSDSCGILFEHTGGTHHNSSLISGNRILNSHTGISMIMSYSNNIARNEIAYSEDYGIIHMVCDGGGGFNVFHHNDFYSNNQGDIQACNLGEGNDCWYSDLDDEGNYWSDYTGPDDNGDGIGDIPYEIDGDQSQDAYPLMVPLYSIVSGFVSDGFEPIQGVYVQATRTEVDDYTDSDGMYSLDSLGAGLYDIVFMHPDYRDTTIIGVPVTPGLITELSIVMSTETELEEENLPAPANFGMFENYPNPFNTWTVISFSLTQADPVTLTVYDLLGRVVRTLLDERRQAGIQRITFDASGLTSGIYICRLQAGESVESRRILLLK